MDVGMPFGMLSDEAREVAVAAAAAICCRSRDDVLESLERSGLAGPLTRRRAGLLATSVDPIRFTAEIRYWNPERASGLAVVDVPPAAAEALGGLKQQRVRGSIGTAAFTSSVMPAGGGRLALSVSKAMMKAAGVGVGDTTDVEITAVGRD